MSLDSLPNILVSASDNSAATKIISELVDNELEDKIGAEADWRVWRLENKYYTAAVRLQPLADAPRDPGDSGEPRAPAEAHVIYLSENEGVAAAEARRSSAAGLLRRGAVRLALVDAVESDEAMVLWGLRARYEVVPLRAADGSEEAGVGRARAALHAHVWPGLRRRGAVRCPPVLPDDEESSDGEGEDRSDEEENAVERAEAFVDALGVLAALAERRGELHDELRREHAEQLVAAFCRALGHDMRD